MHCRFGLFHECILPSVAWPDDAAPCCGRRRRRLEKSLRVFFSSPTVSDERKQKSEAISSIWNVRVFLQRSEMMPSGGQQLRLRQAFYHFLHPVSINLFVVQLHRTDGSDRAANREAPGLNRRVLIRQADKHPKNYKPVSAGFFRW